MRIVRVHDAGGLLLRRFARPVPLAPRGLVRIRLFSRYDLRAVPFSVQRLPETPFSLACSLISCECAYLADVLRVRGV
jgi:hypothetical protein